MIRIALLISSLWMLLMHPNLSYGDVVINEIMASNGNSITDEDGDHTDWIELYNGGNEAINLAGFWLTDDREQMKWQFPEYTIQPGEFLVVFASGKDRDMDELHTNFSISRQGEPVILLTPEGFIADKFEPRYIPRDKSFGRKPDGSATLVYFKSPTPGESNTTEGFNNKLSGPEFSHEGGFYNEAIEVSLHTTYDNAEIRYTLDGSEPDENAPLYDSPISIRQHGQRENKISEINTSPLWEPPAGNIFKGTVVRARVFREGDLPGDIKTHSYFFTPKGAKRYSFPVVSLAIDEKHFFDYETGMYVPGKIYDENFDPDLYYGFRPANYKQTGREWERTANIEYFDREGYTGFSHLTGVRIHGGTSRANPRKSLRFYARADYNQKWFNYPLFDDKGITRSKRFILRNSGDDWHRTLFQDAFMQSLLSNLDVATQGQAPAILFINGEYWGVHNFRERYDKHYLSEVKGADPENIDLISAYMDVKEGDHHHYYQMLEFIQNQDLRTEDNYEHIKTQMDVRNFIDYNVGQMFVNNYDWPGSNIDFWRERTSTGKWRWLVFDLDLGFLHGSGQPVDYNMLEHSTTTSGPTWPNPEWSTVILRNLLKNESFRNQFVNRFADMLNTDFQTDRVVNRLEYYVDLYKPELEEHIERWREPESIKRWESQIERMKSFAFDRPFYQRQHILNFFELETMYKVKLEADKAGSGYIRINTIDIDELEKPWEGVYFHGVPIELTAIPYAGNVFKGWEGDIEESQSKLVIDPDEDIHLIARFEPDSDYEPPFTIPEPYHLRKGDFTFNDWPATVEAGTFPNHMAFHQTFQQDPGLDAPLVSDWTLPYDRSSRSRIIGLDEDGLGFINTSNPQHEPEAGYVGAAVLSLNTISRSNIRVSWTGRTILPNERNYAIRLQYRTSRYEPFRDVLDQYGNPVEYVRNPIRPASERFSEIKLPERVEDKQFIQLQWRYYYKGGDSGPRAKLALDDIRVTSDRIRETEKQPYVIYPNPGKGLFRIKFYEPLNPVMYIAIYTLDGRRLFNERFEDVLSPDGYLDLTHLNEGVYLIKIYNDEHVLNNKLMIRR